MLFNSINFIIFFPIVVIIYYAVPNKMKMYWLLVASYYFYMCWNAKYALLILFSTIVTYLSGLFIEFAKNRSFDNERKRVRLKKFIVALSFLLNLAILFYFKYSNFAVDILKNICLFMNIDINIPHFDIILPVGISFYTFQALSYTMDVYRNDIYAERNFFRYALFVSFFPQLVAGPIERSQNLLKQLAENPKFNFEKARDGFLLMLWGFFLKIVLADRIALFVDIVYGDYLTYGGTYLIIATILFAIQIYCDFSGYSTIAVGTAEILGIKLIDNFDAPYLSFSVAEFWRKWHISLTSWFKDYCYIPLGGSRKGKTRKYVNKLIVFLVSGLWHGAQISFIVWGGLNGVYQILGETLCPVRNKIVDIMHFNRKSFGFKLIQALITFILIDFSWIFFRANGLSEAINIIRQMFGVYNPWILFDGSLYTCGLDLKNFHLMIICIAILLFSDICKYKKIKIREIIVQQDFYIRWISIAFCICFILTFGIWGSGYNDASFIYFQF